MYFGCFNHKVVEHQLYDCRPGASRVVAKCFAACRTNWCCERTLRRRFHSFSSGLNTTSFASRSATNFLTNVSMLIATGRKRKHSQAEGTRPLSIQKEPDLPTRNSCAQVNRNLLSTGIEEIKTPEPPISTNSGVENSMFSHESMWTMMLTISRFCFYDQFHYPSTYNRGCRPYSEGFKRRS